MREIRQPNRRRPSPPGDPAADPFDAAAASDLATITHGPYLEQVPIAGLTLGQVRRRFRDRYNIPEAGLGMVDGHQVDDDTVILAGQLVTFMHRANAKGVGRASAAEVTLRGDDIVVETPEGEPQRAGLAQVVRDLAPRRLGDVVWPDGVKLVREYDRGAIVVHQTPPRVHSLTWIAEDSAAAYGAEASYRRVRIALPYLVVLAVYRVARNGRLQLSGANEAFFANAPLTSVGDPLCYPSLLNVSKMPEPVDAKPLAWICTQYFDRRFEKLAADGERARAALGELLRHLLQDGFNRSSEDNEGASWFGETVRAGVDPRLGSVEAWQVATGDNPLFATEVPWLPTGMTLDAILQRIARYMKLTHGDALGAADLARVVVHRAGRRQAEEGGDVE